MQYEFHGRTLKEAVHNAIEHKDNRKCERLRLNLQRRDDAIARSVNRIERLERSIQRLADDINNGKENFDHDDVGRAIQIAIALASLIPAVRGVRLGISAIRTGVSISQAINNGRSITNGILTALGGAAAINLLATPGLRRELERLKSEVKNELENIGRMNRSRLNVLEQMERDGCNAVLV